LFSAIYVGIKAANKNSEGLGFLTVGLIIIMLFCLASAESMFTKYYQLETKKNTSTTQPVMETKDESSTRK